MSTDKEKDIVNEAQANEGHPAAEHLTPAPEVSIPSSTTTNRDGETTTAVGVSVEKAAEGEAGERKREYKEMEEEHATTRQKKDPFFVLFLSSLECFQMRLSTCRRYFILPEYIHGF